MWRHFPKSEACQNTAYKKKPKLQLFKAESTNIQQTFQSIDRISSEVKLQNLGLIITLSKML